MYSIDYNHYRSIKGFDQRVRFLIFHYTAMDFATSVKTLTSESVSSHYLVPDPTDSSYAQAGFSELKIFNLVHETERAWHAGMSHWSGRKNLNDSSIGIEIVNLASVDDKGIARFPAYNSDQIEATKQLSLNILQRYPNISPTHILGHSDIAIGRKQDPGAAFPWHGLYKAGIGAWYDECVKQKYMTQFDRAMPTQTQIITAFGDYGYDISGTESSECYKNLVRAFQLHFRQTNYNGIMDVETAAILFALVEKYFPYEC